MSTASPQERDLAIGRHAVMAEAFELLADHLGPFIDERMNQYFVDEPSWSEAAANRLGRPTEHGATDPLFQLLVLRRFWGPVFADFYGEDLRQIVSQLIDTRNMWAHFSFPEDPSALKRSVLAIERLLAPVKPEITANLRQLRSRVADGAAGGQNQAEGVTVSLEASAPEGEPKPPEVDEDSPPTKSPAGPQAEVEADVDGAVGVEVDVASLLAQLSETESVFLELQTRYGSLQEELNHTRRQTASEQYKLTAMEKRLVEAEDQSLSVREDLEEERVTRQHIEWLIVGLLATLLLFMVISTTT